MKYRTRFILFALFALIAGIFYFTGSHAAAGAMMLAEGLPAGLNQDAVDYLKHAFAGWDLTNEETLNGLKKAIEDGNSQHSQKLIDVLTEFKNSLPKPSEPLYDNKVWCHSLLSEREQKWDEPNNKEAQKELNRLGFNRYVKLIFKNHMKQTTPEENKLLMDIHTDICTRNGLQTTNIDTEGNFAVPTPMMQLIVDQLSESGLIMSELTQVRLTKRHVVAPIIAASGHPAPTFKAESTTAAAKLYQVGNIVFGQTEFRVKDNGVMIPWTSEMDFDSIVDIGAFIMSYVNDWFNMYGDNILFRGNGKAGNDQIKGLYEVATTPYVLGGNTFDSIKIDDIILGDGQLRSVDKSGLKRYISPSVHAFIKTRKDNQERYLLDSVERLAGTIEGKPVVESDFAYAMTESGANKPMIINANLKKGYLALLNGMGIGVAQSNVASFVDGAITRHAMQENLTVIRLNMPFDIVHPFPNRYLAQTTKP